tara:strand:+ start:6204 stop:6851 length:648 start_codon:yes stop_codon:yes gene_type:complete
MELRFETYHHWLWIPMLVLFIFLAFVFSKYSDQVKRCFLAMFSNRDFADLMRDESQVSKRSSLALNIFSLFSYSFFIFLLILKFPIWGLSDLELYFTINAIVFLGFVFKFLFISSLGFLFKAKKNSDLYIRNSLLSNKVFGIVLFPLALIVAYSLNLGSVFFNGTLILWGFITIFKWYQVVKLGLSLSELPIMYPFLYVCTLEILPTLILLKIFL